MSIEVQIQNFMTSRVDFKSAGYGGKYNDSLEDVANALWNECAQYNRGTLGNKFKEALQGLPSYIDLPFYNGEIESLMYALGYEEEDAVDKYWTTCGMILANCKTAKLV